MASVRLRADQIERLRNSGQGPATIQHAVKRWRRGDFVIGCAKDKSKGKTLLQIYPLWRKPSGVTDWQLREILDKHWETPDAVLQAQIDKELAYWENVVAAELAKLASKGPVIFEDDNERGEE